MTALKLSLILVIASLGFSCCGGQREIEMKRTNKEGVEIYANLVIKSTRYLKDPRTGLCFIYHWGAEHDGRGVFNGPNLALANVPCWRIPPEILIEVKP